MDKSQKYPVRKPNRLNTYDYSTAGMYFITICARNKEKLFGYVTDGDELHLPQMQLSEIGRVVEEQILTIRNAHFISLIKYVVMPNHLHMILQVEEGAEERNTAANAVIPHTIGTLSGSAKTESVKTYFNAPFMTE